jgi:hypothetical protein
MHTRGVDRNQQSMGVCKVHLAVRRVLTNVHEATGFILERDSADL